MGECASAGLHVGKRCVFLPCLIPPLLMSKKSLTGRESGMRGKSFDRFIKSLTDGVHNIAITQHLLLISFIYVYCLSSCIPINGRLREGHEELANFRQLTQAASSTINDRSNL